MKPVPKRERVMLYNLPADTAKGGKIRRVLRDLGISVIEIADGDLGQTIGSCAGISGYSRNETPYTGVTLTDDVMIMVSLSDEKINQLLAQLRKAAAGSIGLMAVVTEHNRSWTLANLFHELSNERRVMAAYVSLQQTIKAAEALSGSGRLPDSSPDRMQPLAQAIADAKALLQLEEPPELDTVKQADEAIKRLMT